MRNRGTLGQAADTDRGAIRALGYEHPGWRVSEIGAAGGEGVADRPLVGPGSELQLTLDGGAVLHEDVLAEAQVLDIASAAPELEQSLVLGEVLDATLPLQLADELTEPGAVDAAAVNL